MADAVSVRLLIEGRVQGVWFRGWMVQTATHLGLKGWVRNRYDGSVEAVVSGPARDVATMVAACRSGPPGAFVATLSLDDAPEPPGTGFRKLPSA